MNVGIITEKGDIILKFNLLISQSELSYLYLKILGVNVFALIKFLGLLNKVFPKNFTLFLKIPLLPSNFMFSRFIVKKPSAANIFKIFLLW